MIKIFFGKLFLFPETLLSYVPVVKPTIKYNSTIPLYLFNYTSTFS